MKAITSRAQKDGIIETSPFLNYKITTDQKQREHLTLKEIARLEKIYHSPILSANEKESLRAFLFCCYTGLRLSDMKTLTYNNINDNTISLNMHKTERQVNIPIIPQAKRFLNPDFKNVVFNVISDQMINKHIRKITEIAKIKKKISFHTARHSFATNSLELDIPKDAVQKMLGHQSVKTTDIYTLYTIKHLKQVMKKWEKA